MIAWDSDTVLTNSFLFVPGDRPALFAKAATSGAHKVIIDLEDAVSPAAKLLARDAVRDFFSAGGQALVRINCLATQWVHQDLALCKELAIQGVVLPKAESAACIATVRSQLAEGVSIFPLIETAIGVVRVHEIAASIGVSRLLFGSVDLGLDLGIEGDGDVFDSHRASLVVASRAAGIASPIDGPTLDFRDAPALLTASQTAKRMGFGGKLCIHPSQVDTVNACFRTTPAQWAWAHKVLAAALTHSGAFALDGKMVDAPVLARARALLLSHGASAEDS